MVLRWLCCYEARGWCWHRIEDSKWEMGKVMIHTHTRGPNGYSKFLERTCYIERAILQCKRESQGYFLPSMHSRATPPSSPLSRLQLSSHTLDILQQLHSRIQALEAYANSAHHTSY